MYSGNIDQRNDAHQGCKEGEECLVADMIALTRRFGRYGYRRVAALLPDAGWQVNDKRVERWLCQIKLV